MFFLNLSPLEFFALLGTLGSAITALYLLDRRKRRRIVSTLRFWTSAVNVEERRSRRHMQQPWSLLLQLLSLVLLLLALARLQWGSRPQSARDHVFLADTSAWSAAPGVLDIEKRTLRSLVRALPPSDRVLIVSTSALQTTPEAFTADRKKWESAISDLRPGASALDLEKAVAFAEAAQRWSRSGGGTVLYVGPARTDHPPVSTPPNLRVIKVDAPDANTGIRAASARQTDDGNWTASFTLRNDGPRPQSIRLRTGFAGTSFAVRRYTLAAHEETSVRYSFVTKSTGLLKAQIEEPDALAADNWVQLDLRNSSPLRLHVVTRRRERLLPLIAPDLFSVEYLEPAQFKESDRADLFVFDEFAPPRAPRAPALFIHPPRENTPLPVKESVRDAVLASWNATAFGDNGLRTRELRFPAADIFQVFKGDLTIASVAEGPVVVARNAASSSPKFVAIGFDLLSEAHRADLTTPLLMANALSWLAPSTFHPDDFLVTRAGALTLPLESNEDQASLRVTNERGLDVPFSVANENIQIFTDRAETIRVASDLRSRQIAPTLPDVAEGTWQPPASALQKASAGNAIGPAAADLWRWLAAAGGLGLLLEWILFGQGRRQLRAGSIKRASFVRSPESQRKERMTA